MILGTGIDVVELARIEQLYQRFGERLLRHVMTPLEREQLRRFTYPIPRLAGRFAAKEAVMKALGTGWRSGVNFTAIEIVNEPSGRPTVQLYRGAAAKLAELGGGRWHLSITHGRDIAVAQAILESPAPDRERQGE